MPSAEDSQQRFGDFTFDVPTLDDLDGLFAINSDPAVWKHDPSYCHRTIDRTREQLENSLQRWEAAALDYWIVHDPTGTVVGSAGARRLDNRWNLFARLSPAVQGRGLAAATQRAAIHAAREVAAELPVVGRLRSTNGPSRRLMERVGLQYQFTAPAVDDGPAWLVYADRALGDEFRQVMEY